MRSLNGQIFIFHNKLFNLHFFKGVFIYSNIQIYGQLSTKFNLTIYFDIFENLNTTNYISLNKNENLDQNQEYYYFIPISVAKMCSSGQFYDISK